MQIVYLFKTIEIDGRTICLEFDEEKRVKIIRTDVNQLNTERKNHFLFVISMTKSHEREMR